MSSSSRTTPSVIVIGAGAAGIAAASRLWKNGIDNVTILEAESRIGGRIYSVEFGDGFIDLGAQWCHGEKNNVIYELMKDMDVLKNDDLVPKLHHSKKGAINEEFQKKFWKIFEDRDSSESLAQSIKERFGRETWEDQALVRESLEWLQKHVLSYEGAFSWLDVTGKGDFEHCEGPWRLSWDGLGFKTILDVLMGQFPRSKILLKKKVCKVTWFDQVQVTCTDDTVLSADHVIVTASLGVLKRCHKTLFQPSLPKEKIEAIQTLGFDAVNKIFLYFPKKWWDQSFNNVSFVWDETELEKTAEAFPDGPKKMGRSWITAIFTIHVVPKCPYLLLARASGEFVPEIENCPDDTIAKGIAYLLQKFLAVQATPDRIIRENWHSNPHFSGTYSFQTVESQRKERSQEEVLSRPLLAVGRPAVLFAGEATHPKYYSTVHGAIESGFREADRLINLYEQSANPSTLK